MTPSFVWFLERRGRPVLSRIGKSTSDLRHGIPMRGWSEALQAAIIVSDYLPLRQWPGISLRGLKLYSPDDAIKTTKFLAP
jgi:hypothetical protein